MNVKKSLKVLKIFLRTALGNYGYVTDCSKTHMVSEVRKSGVDCWVFVAQALS